jgi:hypothetical protein
VSDFTGDYMYRSEKNNNTTNLKIASTYECAGIYWQTEEEGAAKIRYKEVSEDSWRQGLDLCMIPVMMNTGVALSAYHQIQNHYKT